MPEHSFGWIKDKFNPEAVYHRPKVARLAPATNYLQYCPPVRDQGHVGSCTGQGFGGMAYTVAMMGKFADEIYSPTYLYNGARALEGTLPLDIGARPDDVCKWATLYGLLFEHFWPYDPEKLDKASPSSERIAEAIRYPNFQAIRVDNGITGIMAALSDGHCVAIGVPWPAEWMDGSLDVLPIPKPNSDVAGGHETFLFGHDQDKGFFHDQNSWGDGWSVGGRCRIPFEAFDWFKTQGGYDAHYFEFTALSGPNPPGPPPPKKKCWCFGRKKGVTYAR